MQIHNMITRECGRKKKMNEKERERWEKKDRDTSIKKTLRKKRVSCVGS